MKVTVVKVSDSLQHKQDRTYTIVGVGGGDSEKPPESAALPTFKLRSTFINKACKGKLP